MDLPDVINGTYEILGAPFIILSILQLHKDKTVRGIHWGQVLFFSTWGYWNLFYYPHLGQWFSTVGAIALALTNTIWLIQIFYYLEKEKNEKKKGSI